MSNFDSDEGFARKMADLFLSNCPRWLGDIRHAVQAGDKKKLHMAAHSLKGAIGQFTEASPHQLAQRLEEIGKHGSISDADSTLIQLETALHGLQQSLRTTFEETAALEFK